jgi:hypothetical protein
LPLLSRLFSTALVLKRIIAWRTTIASTTTTTRRIVVDQLSGIPPEQSSVHLKVPRVTQMKPQARAISPLRAIVTMRASRRKAGRP